MNDWHSGLPTVDGGPSVAFHEKVRIRDTAPQEALRGRYGWMMSVDEEGRGDIVG